MGIFCDCPAERKRSFLSQRRRCASVHFLFCSQISTGCLSYETGRRGCSRIFPEEYYPLSSISRGLLSGRSAQRTSSNEGSDGTEHTTLSDSLLSHRPAWLANGCGELEDLFVRRNTGSAIRLARECFHGGFCTTAGQVVASAALAQRTSQLAIHFGEKLLLFQRRK